MPRLRVAIIGAGLMGCWHARYAARHGAEIAAIVDPDRAAADALGWSFRRAARFASLEECLSRAAIDVVHICTATPLHFILAEAALESGKHVLIEKPIVGTTAEAARLAELARDRRLKLSCVHQFPFQRGFRRLQREIGRIGEIARIEYRVHSAGGDGLDSARRGNVLLQLLPHAASLLRRLIGGCLTELAWTVHRSGPDQLDLTADRQGILLDLRLSLTARPPLNRLTVTGTRGTAHADLFHGYSYFEEGRVSRSAKLLRPFRQAARQLGSAGTNLAVRALRRQPAYPGLSDLIAEFYVSIRENAPAPIGAEEIFESIRLMECVPGEQPGCSEAIGLMEIHAASACRRF